MAPLRVSAIAAALFAAPRLVAAAAAEVEADADALLVQQDDVCSSDEGCDLSLRQLRATHRHQHETKEEVAVPRALLEANGISSGQEAEVLEASAETGGQLLRLYHQTSAAAGESILRTGFRLGSGGLCGPAIYFSPSAKDTDVKAVGGRGFIIEAMVDMGRMKHMSGQCDHSMNAAKMRQHGWDSITLDRGGFGECWFLPHCYEYIIYDKHRIKSMKGYQYNGFSSWFHRNVQAQPSGEKAQSGSRVVEPAGAASPA
mmetsp:Transcript_58023/g.162714  ORF Transcript_58023/g.162714 Transcript_58023/m.162714 type:complete len:258 (+) Transcript_58023:71-844(+)